MKTQKLTSLMLLGMATAAAAQEKAPNLVLFLADDCSYTDLGCYGSPDAVTPNIDNFAKQGMQFNACYQAAPMSSPTRHNLFTGLWPVCTGAYPNHTTANPGTNSIVQHLRPLGYKVALAGKSHIGPDEVFPFDRYIPLSGGGEVDFDAVEDFMKGCIKDETPYCLLVTSHQPHTPWTKGDRSLYDASKLSLPPMWVDTPETRGDYVKYLAEVSFMDSEFGSLLHLLDKYGQSDEAFVIYLSEQGNSFPFAKWTCYNSGVHSACLVRWPGKIKAGSVSDAMVEYVDVTPTFVDIAGGQPQSPMDGESFKNVLLGKTKHHKDYTYSLQTSRGIHGGPEFYGIRSVADARYRYILNLTPDASFKCLAMNSGFFSSWKAKAENDKDAAWTVDRFQHRPAEELYDTEKDPYCLNNLAGQQKYARKLVELRGKLQEWMTACGDEGQATELRAKEFIHRAPHVGAVPKNKKNDQNVDKAKKGNKGKADKGNKGKGNKKANKQHKKTK